VKLLLDTHSFIWFIEGNPLLSATARPLIEEPANDVFLSVASLWEMAIKISIGKLQLREPFDQLVPQQIQLNNITLLNIAISHTVVVTQLPYHHRDPFDRLLIAQSITENLPLVSSDGVFDQYGVNRVW
jgi:PIN domain nuclease of toxin-antitoxin system